MPVNEPAMVVWFEAAETRAFGLFLALPRDKHTPRDSHKCAQWLLKLYAMRLNLGQMTARPKVLSTPTDQEIYDRIYGAILERRLQPGVHLRENDLANMFGVGRTKVRQALVKLVEVGVVQVERNRGASVAAPSKLEA